MPRASRSSSASSGGPGGRWVATHAGTATLAAAASGAADGAAATATHAIADSLIARHNGATGSSVTYVPGLGPGDEREGYRVVVIGGSARPHPHLTRVSVLAISTAGVGKDFEWSTHVPGEHPRPAEVSVAPPHRWGHSACLVDAVPGVPDAGPQVFVFGGFSSRFNFGDGWVFEVDRNRWFQAPLHVTDDTDNAYRSYHSCVSDDRGNMLIFGGAYCNGGPYVQLNDVVSVHLDSGATATVRTTGAAPCGRSQHSACVSANSMVVFGGWDSRQVLNDVHLLDLDTHAWSRVDTTGSPPPSVKGLRPVNYRIYPARRPIVATGACVYVFGGAVERGKAGAGAAGTADLSGQDTIKVYALDLLTKAWTKVKMRGGASASGAGAEGVRAGAGESERGATLPAWAAGPFADARMALGAIDADLRAAGAGAPAGGGRGGSASSGAGSSSKLDDDCSDGGSHGDGDGKEADPELTLAVPTLPGLGAWIAPRTRNNHACCLVGDTGHVVVVGHSGGYAVDRANERRIVFADLCAFIDAAAGGTVAADTSAGTGAGAGSAASSTRGCAKDDRDAAAAAAPVFVSLEQTRAELRADVMASMPPAPVDDEAAKRDGLVAVVGDHEITADRSPVTVSPPVWAHRTLLEARSPFFRAMFATGMAEARSSRVHLEGVSPACVQLIVRYMYGHGADVPGAATATSSGGSSSGTSSGAGSGTDGGDGDGGGGGGDSGSGGEPGDKTRQKPSAVKRLRRSRPGRTTRAKQRTSVAAVTATARSVTTEEQAEYGAVAVEALHVAHRLELSPLLEELEVHVAQAVAHDNAAALLETAHMVGAKYLEDACIQQLAKAPSPEAAPESSARRHRRGDEGKRDCGKHDDDGHVDGDGDDAPMPESALPSVLRRKVQSVRRLRTAKPDVARRSGRSNDKAVTLLLRSRRAASGTALFADLVSLGADAQRAAAAVATAGASASDAASADIHVFRAKDGVTVVGMHRWLLATRCPVLYSMIPADSDADVDAGAVAAATATSAKPSVVDTDIEPTGLRAVAAHVYTGDCAAYLATDAGAVFEAAAALCMPVLRDRAAGVLMHAVTPERAALIWQIASAAGAAAVRNRCERALIAVAHRVLGVTSDGAVAGQIGETAPLHPIKVPLPLWHAVYARLQRCGVLAGGPGVY